MNMLSPLTASAQQPKRSRPFELSNESTVHTSAPRARSHWCHSGAPPSNFSGVAYWVDAGEKLLHWLCPRPLFSNSLNGSFVQRDNVNRFCFTSFRVY